MSDNFVSADLDVLIHLRDCYQELLDGINDKSLPGYAAYDVIDISVARKSIRDLNDMINYLTNI